jgi:hypothetical protein
VSTKSYWKESLECALDSYGLLSAIPSDALDKIAGDLETSYENIGTAMGYDAIPNPLQTEIKELKTKHHAESERKERHYEAAIGALKQEVGRVHNIDPRRIHVSETHGITVSRT